MPEETARLDFTKPPPGYTVDGQWWSFPAPPRAPHPRDIGSPQAFSIAMVAPNSGGLVAAWAHYKAHNDPLGMWAGQARGEHEGGYGFGLMGSDHEHPLEADFDRIDAARAAAWAWYERRLALAARISSAAVADVETFRGRAIRTIVPLAEAGYFDGQQSPLDVWPRILTWTDEQVAEVERWLVDSTAETPEVLGG